MLSLKRTIYFSRIINVVKSDMFKPHKGRFNPRHWHLWVYLMNHKHPLDSHEIADSIRHSYDSPHFSFISRIN